MRALFDGHWWVEGPHANRTVQRELILAWSAAFPDDELAVAVPLSALAQARDELPAGVDVVGTRLRPHGLSVIAELPLVARRVHADVVVTHNFTPPVGRSAVFVHDLMFETDPQWFTRVERAYFSLMTRTLPRASVVATSSRVEASRIARVARVRVPVHAIGLGVPSALLAADPAPVGEVDDVDEIALVVARLNVRKNLATVLRAATQAASITPARPLVVVGESSGRPASVPDEARARLDDGSIRMVGRISDAQLSWLYRRARPFIFLSLDEGFGIPALEALALGAPVVASDIPVFREVLGTTADLVSPHDVGAVAMAIDRASTTPRPPAIDVATLGWSWDASARRLREAVSGALPSVR